MTHTVSLELLSGEDLRRHILRFERAIFAGTSSHKDVLDLILCEQELLRRERLKLAERQRREATLRASQSRSGEKSAALR